MSGSPWLTVGKKTPGTPILLNCLPVINAALEPEQTGQPEYQVERTLPPYANLSMLGVVVVGCPLKPTSPYLCAAWKTKRVSDW